ncbi:MAG: HlyD family efflux transporter periplasmic adaptor subunit [Bryobacteraceae bacterium]|nr:HlyD family efflux transporter periplasmic adaptor subunit [Bryobacteraceae bacterium]
MDVPRKSAARNRLIRRIVTGVILVAVVTITSIGLSRLKPAAPSVESGILWTDTVKRGPMLRNVRGLGTLVPEEILFITAINQGRVERKLALPGDRVRPDSVLLELSNPELELAAVEAEYQVKAAEAKLLDLKVQLESQHLQQKAELARLHSEYKQANLKADRDVQLSKEGLIPDIDLKLSRTTAEELGNRYELEQQKLTIHDDAVRAQLEVQRAEIERLRALHKLKMEHVQNLRVRAGAEGVLQELDLEFGQQVAPGAILAKVVQPTRLKAELKIPETQAKDVLIGQKAQIDTRNGIIAGSVSRIDPAVREGTVLVDVKLEGPLPTGARPDLSVDGTIELERLDDVLFVNRPAFGQQDSQVRLFRVSPDGKEAGAVQVRLGRSSVNTIEILEGLQIGDKVILSDMSNWDAYDRVRLN